MKDTQVVPTRRRTSRWATLVSLAVLATATALVGTASSAAADPTNCTTVNGGTYAESRCTDGTGEHRVVMRQRHFDPTAGMIVCEGPWVPPGTVSRTNCAAHTVISVTVETRAGSGPGMGPQPVPPTPPDPTPQPSLDCRVTANGTQLYVLPIGFKALWYGFTMEYCYDSARDLVRVTPRVILPQVQLPLEELSRGLPVGTVGVVSVTAAIPVLGQITQNDAPVRTSQGQTYNGLYTVNLSFTPRGGARQVYQSAIGVVINATGAFPTPPILIRFS